MANIWTPQQKIQLLLWCPNVCHCAIYYRMAIEEDPLGLFSGDFFQISERFYIKSCKKICQ
ncbi:hypothetical protein C0J52_27298 [Blattella germanica]|nr:hypothetical protein C0J52_27298 [Blattella germanica]